MKKQGLDTVAMIVAIVLVIVFVVVESYSVTKVNIQTQTAVVTTVNETIDTKALVVREEHILTNASNGVVVPCINDGDKINVGGNVAMVFDSTESATAYSQKIQLLSQLEYYENLQLQSANITANIESLNNQIYQDVNTYIRSIYSKDTQQVQNSSTSLNDSLVRRQILIGEQIDFSSNISDINAKLNALTTTSPKNYITTDKSGIFSTYTDGYEDFVNYDKVGELTPSQVNDYISQVSADKDTDANIGKLVTDYSWYMVCVVPSDSVQNMKNGNWLKVALKDMGDTVLDVKILTGAEVEQGQSETVLVLECNDMNSQLITQRCPDIQIITNTYTGIKVPVDAVHINNDQKGVYALISYQVRFRQADVIYTTADYVILSYDANNDKGIRLYDQIITQGKDLKDGKIYT